MTETNDTNQPAQPELGLRVVADDIMAGQGLFGFSEDEKEGRPL